VRTRMKVGVAWCGVIAFAGAGLGGCGGGGGRLSAARYAREASNICAAANHHLRRIQVPALTDQRSASRAVAHIVVIQRDSIDELRGLKPPEDLGNLNASWIALLDQGTDELELVSVSLGSSKGHLAQNYADNASILFDRAAVVVKSHGVTSCRGPSLELR
jgi:hypothetical protein